MTGSEQLVDDVRRLVAEEAGAAGDGPATAGWLRRLCRAASRDLPASGVGVSLLSETGDFWSTAASDSTSALVEELQFSFGEGPCIAAYTSRMPVLVPDLAARATTSWPGYAPAADEYGVKAVFAFPLQIGVARLGALDVYREGTGSLSASTLARALAYAEVAVEGLVDPQQHPDDMASSLADATDNRLEVYQAQGMVMIQLGVTPVEALARMRARAYAQEQRLVDVAADIIARRLRLESDDL